MIEIRPDPQHPRGGFAELSVAGTAAQADPVTVAVFDNYQQKWLGPDGWQPNRCEMPTRAATRNGDTLRLIVGPDIVNKIEEDTPIKIEIGGNSWDTYWPDTINAGPDEAIIGDIGGTGAAPQAKGPSVVAPPVEPDDTELQSPVVTPASSEKAPPQPASTAPTTEQDSPPTKSRLPMVLAALAVVIALATAAFFFLAPDDTEKAATPTPETGTAQKATPQTSETSNPCNLSKLAEMGAQGFGAMAGKLRDCSGSLSADNALGLVEKGAAADDPDALALFGALYDAGVTDAAIEKKIGLSFSDQPSRAAEYYARAIKAGSTEAASRLQSVCKRLRLKSDTLSQGAYDDYCQ